MPAPNHLLVQPVLPMQHFGRVNLRRRLGYWNVSSPKYIGLRCRSPATREPSLVTSCTPTAVDQETPCHCHGARWMTWILQPAAPSGDDPFSTASFGSQRQVSIFCIKEDATQRFQPRRPPSTSRSSFALRINSWIFLDIWMTLPSLRPRRDPTPRLSVGRTSLRLLGGGAVHCQASIRISERKRSIC